MGVFLCGKSPFSWLKDVSASQAHQQRLWAETQTAFCFFIAWIYMLRMKRLNLIALFISEMCAFDISFMLTNNNAISEIRPTTSVKHQEGRADTCCYLVIFSLVYCLWSCSQSRSCCFVFCSNSDYIRFSVCVEIYCFNRWTHIWSSHPSLVELQSSVLMVPKSAVYTFLPVFSRLKLIRLFYLIWINLVFSSVNQKNVTQTLKKCEEVQGFYANTQNSSLI